MENTKENLWYLNLDWSMIWVCLIAVAVHILYLDINKKAINYTFKNYLFYILSSILVLTFISEIANWFIVNYTSATIDIQNNVSHFLAALSGLSGGYVTSHLIKKIKSKINKLKKEEDEDEDDDDEDKGGHAAYSKKPGAVTPGRGF